MAKHTGSTFLRRKLGAKLRRMREAAEFSLDDAAPRLDKTRSALHRMETGETRVDVHMVRSMMDLYDIYDPDLIEEAREAYKPPWYRPYGVTNMGYVDVETEAAHVSEFSVTVLPGLLQTEEYTRALLSYWDFPRPDDELAVRQVRRGRLTDQKRPLRLTAVIDQAVLARPVGGPDVMREQMRHLLAVADLPTVELHVLPAELGAPSASVGTFILLGFPNPEDPELLYVEHVTGSAHIEDQEELRKARLVFERLRIEALDPADSVALVERAAEELYDQ